MAKIDVENMLVAALKVPGVRVNRESFLRTELKKYDEKVVDLAIKYNPAYAGIDVTDIDKIAKACIRNENILITGASVALGIPGGAAAVGGMLMDVTNYYGGVLRILQKLAYLYGWKDFELKSDEIDEQTKSYLLAFLGVMFGVKEANCCIAKLSALLASNIAKKLPKEALTKQMFYQVTKSVLKVVGVKLTKDSFAKGVSKVVPIAGGVVSGGITCVSFMAMAERLRNHLSSLELADAKTYSLCLVS